MGVKAPQFSYSRLKGADPILSVEMNSTGEVACIGDTLNEAFLKAVLSAGMEMPKRNVLVSIGGDKNKYLFLDWIRKLHKAGYAIYATEHTSQFYEKKGIPNTMLYKAHNTHKPNNIITMMQNGGIDLVINIPKEMNPEELEDEYIMRRNAVDYSIPLLTNMQVAKVFVDAMLNTEKGSLRIMSWNEYR